METIKSKKTKKRKLEETSIAVIATTRSTTVSTTSTSSEEVLEAVKIIAYQRHNNQLGLDERALEAAELLTTPAVLVKDYRYGGHGVRLVIQWVVNQLGIGSIGQDTKLTKAIQNNRLWKVCLLALKCSSASTSSSITTKYQATPPLSSTLSLNSALSLFQAIHAIVFSSPSSSSSTKAASEVATQVFAALTGLPYPPNASLTLASAPNNLGLPQIPFDKLLEGVIIPIVTTLSSSLSSANGTSAEGANLTTLALQYLVLLQRHQSNQRKLFTTVVGRLLEPLCILYQAAATASASTRRSRQLLPPPHHHKGLGKSIEWVFAEILFHREHLEGLRSLLLAAAAAASSQKKKKEEEKKGTKKTEWTAYQSLLFEELEAGLQRREHEGEQLALSLPSIYRIFVQRLESVRSAPAGAVGPTNNNNNKKSSEEKSSPTRVLLSSPSAALGSSVAADAVAFNLYIKVWSMLWCDDKRRSSRRPSPARLQACQDLLEAVWKLNIYNYSADRGVGGQFHRLEEIFSAILLSVASSSSSAAGDHDPTLRIGEIRCLSILLRIDHRVMQTRMDELIRVLALCCYTDDDEEEGPMLVSPRSTRWKERSEKKSNNQSSILLKKTCVRITVEIVETYAKLRQMEVVLQSFLSVSEEASLDTEAAVVVRERQVECLLSQSDVLACMSRAMRECPPPQILPLYDLLNPVNRLHPSTLRMNLFKKYLENLRVSALNAHELRQRVLSNMEQWAGSILRQSQVEVSEGSQRRQGRKMALSLEVYAKLLNIQVVCDYWTGSPSRCQGLDELLQRLLLGVRLHHEEEAAGRRTASSELNCLVVGRLRQILQEEGVRGLLSSANDREKEIQMKEEKTRLAAFLFENTNRIAEEAKGEKSQQILTELAQSLPLWASYVGQEQLDRFWRGLLLASQTQSLNRRTPAGIAMALLTDATFYEVVPLAERFLPCWTRCLFENFPPSPEHETIVRLIEQGTAEQFLHTLEKKLKTKDDARGRRSNDLIIKEKAQLQTILHLFKLLNSLPLGYLSSLHQQHRFLLTIFCLGCLQQDTATTTDDIEVALSRSLVDSLRLESASLIPLLLKKAPRVQAYLAQHIITATSSTLSQTTSLELLALYYGEVVRTGVVVNSETFIALLEQNGLSKACHSSKEKEFTGGLKILIELLYPYTTTTTNAERQIDAAAAAAAGKPPSCLLKLVHTIHSKLLQRLSTCQPEVLELFALILRLDQRHQREEDILPPLLSSQDVSILLSHRKKKKINASSSSPNASSFSLMQFLASYLCYYYQEGGRRSSQQQEEEEEGMILKAMVRLTIEEREMEPRFMNEICAKSLQRAASLTSQKEALAVLEGSLAEIKDVQEEEGDLVLFSRISLLFQQVIQEMDVGGSSSQSGRKAVLRIARTMFNHTVYLSVKLTTTVNASASNDNNSEHQRSQCFQALISSLSLLRLYVQKRWLFSSLCAPPSSIVTTEVEAAVSDDAVEEEEEEKGYGGSDDSDRDAKGPPVCAAAPASTRQDNGVTSAGSCNSSIRVLAVGQILMSVTNIPHFLLTSIEEQHPAQKAKTRKSLTKSNCEGDLFTVTCSLLSALLRYQERSVYQATAPFILIVRALFRILVHGDIYKWDLGPSAVKSWVQLIEHTSYHASAFRKNLIFLIVDYLALNPQLSMDFKSALQPGIYALMDTMTSFEIQHLHSALLDSAGKALLKKTYGEYQQRYKYRGKV